MSSFVHFSGSATLALHAMAMLAARPEETMTVAGIAESIGASTAHLHKVVHQLVRKNMLRSVRGPGGGISAGRPLDTITLYEVVEAVDGPFSSDLCRMETKSCSDVLCVYGDILGDVNDRVIAYLNGATVASLAGVYGAQAISMSGHHMTRRKDDAHGDNHR